jgi:hypothetical protein
MPTTQEMLRNNTGWTFVLLGGGRGVQTEGNPGMLFVCLFVLRICGNEEKGGVGKTAGRSEEFGGREPKLSEVEF